MIQNNLFGVDIDESSIEIAKLRLWLSLTIDVHETEIIEPLPNLDYNLDLSFFSRKRKINKESSFSVVG